MIGALLLSTLAFLERVHAGNLSMPVAPVACLNVTSVCFLLACQGITLPQMYTAAVANIINVAANYALIFSLQWGVV